MNRMIQKVTHEISQILTQPNRFLEVVSIFSQSPTLYIQLFLQWVPAHVNVPGNELADKAAKAATKLPVDSTQIAVPFSSAKAVINREIADPPPSHPRVAKSYQGLCHKRDNKLIGSRKEQALLAQLRAGHCLKLAHYRHRINPEDPETCEKCEEEPETVEHWLRCPATRQHRMDIFQRPDVDLEALATEQAKVLAYASRTLREM